MSTNHYKPHVLILPEDRANAQVATGFVGETSPRYQAIQILQEAGGWMVALGLLEGTHVPNMRRFPERILVLVIDFDGQFADRIKLAKGKIPPDLMDRVFILGTQDEPEALRAELGSYETIGRGLAQDCREQTNHIWQHPQLQHNAGEVARLAPLVRSFLFY
uniref:Uncharacterized protein n=1 Tax=mine drainage metagenome TaxID=410659 RepID=E6QI75_9ZZZZ